MKPLILAFIIAFTLQVKPVSAISLRGQIVKNVGGQLLPAAGVRVDLMIWNGKAWTDVSYAVTDSNGFYFFLNLTTPAGTSFCMNISGRYFPSQSPFTIQATPSADGYQDIQVISI
jgi:5-hydroxyisourate hydrolase-like protein (transthyretin family)